MKKKFGDYYLGLDIGTGSVGWAVTDLDYNLMRLNGKDMWGVRLFPSGETAEIRRMKRSAKRRGDRKKRRIQLLQELFAEEISKKDVSFFQRLQDSKYHIEDKESYQKNTLFNDRVYSDSDYHSEFPTIYHLRHALISQPDRVFDIRLVYLAIAHILKKRGHFHFKGSEITDLPGFEVLYNDFSTAVNDLMDLSLPMDKNKELEAILIKPAGLIAKKTELEQIFNRRDIKIVANLLSGSSVKLAALFKDDALLDVEPKSVKLSDPKFDEYTDNLQEVLEDRFLILEAAKKLHDYGELAKILKNNYLSLDKIGSFNKHKDDLKQLKKIFQQYFDKKEYSQFFRDTKSKNNYCAYIGESTEKDNSSVCSKEDFYKGLKNMLVSKDNIHDENVKAILEEIGKGTFLPKQSSSENSVIPYQFHLYELKKILDNTSKHHPFITEVDANGITTQKKIESLLTFRIPYYVGPLNTYHKSSGGNSWIVKKTDEKIYPWNFEKVVDLDASQEEFILRMTNKCTYLIGADVLPKQSILYSRYMVLNELNNLKINGQKLSVSVKQALFHDLILKKKRVTAKAIRNYLMSNSMIDPDGELSGIDIDLKSSMSSYISIRNILGNVPIKEDEIDEIIKISLIMGDEKRALEMRLMKSYGAVYSKAQIRKIANLNFSGWGRFSRELLTEVYHTDAGTGERFSIVRMLWETDENFMQLLSDRYQFAEQVDQYNSHFRLDFTEYDYNTLVKELYCSPAVKRGIWQALTIVKELRGIMGHDPRRVFVEVTRGEEEKKTTKSRKTRLLELYKNCKEDARNWSKELKDYNEGQLRSKVLYLYYTQMGRCAYSGDLIDLGKINDKKFYEIDHIYPRSLTKDDSFSNLVLVKTELNQAKKDNYPLPESYQSAQTIDLWRKLKAMELITPEKFDRLTRVEELKDDELASFISRQLVETSQSSKAVAECLQLIFPEQTKTAYVKSGHVSDFRNDFDLVKVRSLNDLHHAKDAYLNIVVGNVYHTKFTSSPYNFVREKRSKQSYRPYSLRKMFEKSVERNGVVAWNTESNHSLNIVKNTMKSNNVRFTRLAHEVTGAFYDEMPMKKGKGQIPLKSNDPRMQNIEKYGAYNNDSGAYFILVEHTLKNRRIRTMGYIPVRIANEIEDNPELLLSYCRAGVPNGLGLSEPIVLCEKIKIDSLLKINGYSLHLSGRSNVQLLLKSAIQFWVKVEDEKYLKKVEKFANRRLKNKKTSVTSHDNITIEENIRMYDLFLEKFENSIYQYRPNEQSKTLKKGREQFCSLNIEQQCEVLFNMMGLFSTNNSEANLKLIGGGESSGSIRISRDISKQQSALLIHQSPTGLFETKVDLLAL